MVLYEKWLLQSVKTDDGDVPEYCWDKGRHDKEEYRYIKR